MKNIIVEQKETIWYRTTYEVPIDISDLEFIEMLQSDDPRLQLLDTDGDFIDGSSEQMKINENDGQPTIEVKLSKYGEPIWNNVEGLLTDD